MNAQEYANSLNYPVVFIAGVGIPGGQSIAILPETELPFDLEEIEGSENQSAIFEAGNLNDGSGAHGWKFHDWNHNLIYKIQVFDDIDIWSAQNQDQNVEV